MLNRFLEIIRRLTTFVAAGLLAFAVPAFAQQKPSLSEDQCTAILAADFSQLEDAPGKLLSAKLVSASGNLATHCEVIGYVWRQVRFRVRLPVEGWNGKLVVFGTGGQAGSFMPDVVTSESSALKQGFATATHDGGHVSTMLDAQWAYQDESALLDYGFRAPHVAGLIARAVVRTIYGRAATRVYFSGCSNGGREALQMAQRYPSDYDGIIAGAPSLRWSELFSNIYWFANRTVASTAVLDSSALRLLHRAAMDQCDRSDGRKDGIIDDPRKCKVDLVPISCAQGSSTDCLSAVQARAAREIYDGPRDATGKRVTFSSAMPGSELTWSSLSLIANYPQSVFRFQSFMPAAGPTFAPDETKLADYIRRSGGSDAILSATNPDLRRFRDNGGKLLSFMGWNDAIGGIHQTIDYHATVERTMGGRAATSAFYRLFMVPGMNHCTGGDGAYEIDWLTALDAWVDSRKAPDGITGYHPNDDGTPSFSRTVAPFISTNMDR